MAATMQMLCDQNTRTTITTTASPRRRKNKGKGRRRNQVNKKPQSLRRKQRKNKKLEKVELTKKRQGRSVGQAEARQTGQGCDPIEVRTLNVKT